MKYTNLRECEHEGLDPKEVERIARNLSRWALEAQKLGLTVFGGSGSADLRTRSSTVVADLDGWFDGGDGGTQISEGGLIKGETFFEEGGR